MLRSSESETEILLGNKQLLGIFFVVTLLLAVAFYGGFAVGRSSSAKKLTANAAASSPEETGANPARAAGETHLVAAGQSNSGDDTPANSDGSGSQELQPATHAHTAKNSPAEATRSAVNRTRLAEAESGNSPTDSFAPQVGEQFLQVAAVSKDEAEAVADVLHKKGFRAHAVPKPGNPKLYRVIIGPIRDTGDLSSTREALMRTGFREVILQRY